MEEPVDMLEDYMRVFDSELHNPDGKEITVETMDEIMRYCDHSFMDELVLGIAENVSEMGDCGFGECYNASQ